MKEGSMTLSKNVLNKIEKIVGKENYFPAEADRVCYAADSSLLSQMNRWVPDLVVRVMTTEQVSAILTLANEEKVPVVPRGAGTGQCSGAVAHRAALSWTSPG